jgi:hypothetical protein
MKNYLAIEAFVLSGATATLLGIPGLGRISVVLPLIVLIWVTLQLISSVAFCNAIHKGQIVAVRGPRGSKEVYFVANGAKLGWLVKRHIWVYELIRETNPQSAVSPASPRSR